MFHFQAPCVSVVLSAQLLACLLFPLLSQSCRPSHLQLSTKICIAFDCAALLECSQPLFQIKSILLEKIQSSTASVALTCLFSWVRTPCHCSGARGLGTAACFSRADIPASWVWHWMRSLTPDRLDVLFLMWNLYPMRQLR